jgi:hypothetical protein
MLNKFPEHPAHAAFTPQPLHHFDLKIKGHPDVKVQTCFPLCRANSKAFKDELTTFVRRVEAEQAVSMKKPKPFKFFK